MIGLLVLAGFVIPTKTDLVLDGDTHKGLLYGCIEEKSAFSFKHIEKCWIVRR